MPENYKKKVFSRIWTPQDSSNVSFVLTTPFKNSPTFTKTTNSIPKMKDMYRLEFLKKTKYGFPNPLLGWKPIEKGSRSSLGMNNPGPCSIFTLSLSLSTMKSNTGSRGWSTSSPRHRSLKLKRPSSGEHFFVVFGPWFTSWLVYFPRNFLPRERGCNSTQETATPYHKNRNRIVGPRAVPSLDRAFRNLNRISCFQCNYINENDYTFSI